MKRTSLALGACWLLAAAAFGADEGTWALDPVACEITLPNGEQYARGATSPVKDLIVELVLTNKSKKENLNPETVGITEYKYITQEDLLKLENELVEEEGGKYVENLNRKIKELLASEKYTKPGEIKQYPVNKESLGVAYNPPELGYNDNVQVLIKPVALALSGGG
jgi:hypothetical protein